MNVRFWILADPIGSDEEVVQRGGPVCTDWRDMGPENFADRNQGKAGAQRVRIGILMADGQDPPGRADPLHDPRWHGNGVGSKVHPGGYEGAGHGLRRGRAGPGRPVWAGRGP